MVLKPPEMPFISLESAPGPHDISWDRAPWLADIRSVPSDATWPRLMSAVHRAAVGSYGGELIAWSAERGVDLRWWQRLAALRLLEHDDQGALVYPWWLLSTARQVGKSWLLRELLLWRIHQGERFGEPQLVLHTGKDLPVCREIQRPARAWARRSGYTVRDSNGMEEIEAADGSRWIIRGRDSVYGYSASMGVVDEAWKVPPATVEDGMEPTMAERASAQLGLLSTAHRLATALFPARRQAAIAALGQPSDALLLEWSAERDAALDDRDAWRQASPAWSARRERLVDAQYQRALTGGRSDDPDEPDPVESFRSQWLNVWPDRSAVQDRSRVQPLLADGAWEPLVDLAASVPGSLVLAIDDHYGKGAALAAGGLLPDGRVLLWGRTFQRRTELWPALAMLTASHPGSRLRVGAPLANEPGSHAVVVAERVVAGGPDTRAGLALLRDLVATGRIVHDGSHDLAVQVTSARVSEGAAGLSIAVGTRADLVRCAAWIVAALQSPRRVPAPFVVR
jgi:hypothetical protein